MTHIGFTGTRHGMTPAQQGEVADLVDELAPPMITRGHVMHHGDCVGADAEFHGIASGLGNRVVIHPGPISEYSAGCIGDERRAPKPHMARNRDIVTESQVMIAAPFEATEQDRGGTWATIRMARKTGRPLAIVWRDGRVTRERWDVVVTPPCDARGVE